MSPKNALNSGPGFQTRLLKRSSRIRLGVSSVTSGGKLPDKRLFP